MSCAATNSKSLPFLFIETIYAGLHTILYLYVNLEQTHKKSSVKFGMVQE